MAELMTGLIALPALYLIGDVYLRAGRWLWRTLAFAASGRAAPGELEPMPDNGRYDVALAAASCIVQELANRPEMSQAEKLSTLTFAILRAMRQAEMPQGWVGRSQASTDPIPLPPPVALAGAGFISPGRTHHGDAISQSAASSCPAGTAGGAIIHLEAVIIMSRNTAENRGAW